MKSPPLWIVIFMSLHITVHHEKSWWLLEHFFVFIAVYNRSWSIMMHTQKSWNIMMVIKTVMMHHELVWYITNPYGKIPKDFVNNHEKSWSIMICNITLQSGLTQRRMGGAPNANPFFMYDNGKGTICHDTIQIGILCEHCQNNDR